MATKGPVFRYFLGYPRPYAGLVALKAGCLLGCLPLALVPVGLAAFYFCRFRVHFHLGPLLAFLLSVLLVWIAVAGLYAMLMPPQVTPRFEPRMRHCAAWELAGFLPRRWRTLDRLAIGQGLLPFSA
ncbi:MAG: hypothetical protein K8T20_05495, partial [Planctomycetes bacterium]|nr:hypothetical protein [Planctomycetota bacterium]